MADSGILKSLSQRLGLDPEEAKIRIIGLGQTGFSVARFLHSHGFKIVIVDSRDNPPLNQQLMTELPDIPVFCGGFDQEVLTGASDLIVSPGVSLNEQVIQQATAKGVRVLSDIDLFACSVSAPIVAITGSNGKSTVTTMLGKMAEAEGKRVAVGGNIGIPALDILDASIELYVLELSSFQLERTRQLNATAATVLNVSPDHLDRYQDEAEYAEEKRKIFNGNGVMVINQDDPVVARMAEPDRTVVTFGLDHPADYHLATKNTVEYLVAGEQYLLPVQTLPLVGRHNQANALAALALGDSVGLSGQAMCSALKDFKGLEHRMQLVANIDGVSWVNDSKATNIGACIAALQGCQSKVVLIAGGDAKGADMNELAPVIKDKTKAVVLIGKDADIIEQALTGSVRVYSAVTLPQAVTIASGLAQTGDSVLLSPACASLDQFENYQQRGRIFTEAVKRLVA